MISFIERALYCHQLIAELKQYVHPEFMLWATSSSGVLHSRKCYETLETYGDTILKLAATLLAFQHYKDNTGAGEKELNDLKNAFVTNLHLNRIGGFINLKKYIRTKDPEPKLWQPAFCKSSEQIINVSCTGK